MLFDCVLGAEEVPKNSRVIFRKAVRAVIFSDKSKLLLVHNSNGDYKFPGGGMEEGESIFETLKRETLEEIGVVIKNNIKLLGIITEQNIDKKDPEAYFVMKSYYYQCFIDSYYGSVCLDEYEKELSFKLKEIDMFEAYKINSELLIQTEVKSTWLRREVLALEQLMRYYNNGGLRDEQTLGNLD